jgi:hypothetical protein
VSIVDISLCGALKNSSFLAQIRTGWRVCSGFQDPLGVWITLSIKKEKKGISIFKIDAIPEADDTLSQICRLLEMASLCKVELTSAVLPIINFTF